MQTDIESGIITLRQTVWYLGTNIDYGYTAKASGLFLDGSDYESVERIKGTLHSKFTNKYRRSNLSNSDWIRQCFTCTKNQHLLLHQRNSLSLIVANIYNF